MFEIFVYSLIAVFVIVGLCDLLHSMWMFFLRPKNRVKGYYITYLNDELDYLTLTYLYEKQKWYGSDFADSVIVVADDEADQKLVSEFSEKGIVFVNRDIFKDNYFRLGVLNEKQGIQGNS